MTLAPIARAQRMSDGRIADHPDLLALDIPSQVPAGFGVGRSGDVVAVVVVVAESAVREVVVELVVRELQPGTLFEVAGQQAHRDVVVRREIVEQFDNAGENRSRQIGQGRSQVFDVRGDE